MLVGDEVDNAGGMLAEATKNPTQRQLTSHLPSITTLGMNVLRVAFESLESELEAQVIY